MNRAGLRNLMSARRSAGTGSEGAAARAAPRAPPRAWGSFGPGRGSAPSPPAAWAGPPPGLPEALREGSEEASGWWWGEAPAVGGAKCAEAPPASVKHTCLTCNGYWGAKRPQIAMVKKNNRTLVPSAFLSSNWVWVLRACVKVEEVTG